MDVQGKRRATALVLASLLTCPAAALAQRSGAEVAIPPDVAGEASDDAGAQLVDVFGRFCLMRFPDHADMAEGMGGAVVPLSPQATREFLHDDPGHGWLYKAAEGTYVVTVEDPPYHTCAVRRLYATPPKYRLAYALAVGLWAAAADRGPLQSGASQTVKRNGLTIAMASRVLPPAAGKGVETFMELRTTYPNGRVEIRLARALAAP